MPTSSLGRTAEQGESQNRMNWISNVVRPKIRSFLNRRDSPENLWIKCPETGQLVFYKDVEANSFVIPGSDYYMRMSATGRIKSSFDCDSWFDIMVKAALIDRHNLGYNGRYTWTYGRTNIRTLRS